MLDIPCSSPAIADDHESFDEMGEDWLGNNNLGEYRAAWQRGETDLFGRSTAAAAAEEEVTTGSANRVYVLDVPAAAAAAADDDSSADWLGSHNVGEYRAAWQRGVTDTNSHVDSVAAAAEEEEEVRSSSATGPHAAMGAAASARSAAAGGVVVQVRDVWIHTFSSSIQLGPFCSCTPTLPWRSVS